MSCQAKNVIGMQLAEWKSTLASLEEKVLSFRAAIEGAEVILKKLEQVEAQITALEEKVSTPSAQPEPAPDHPPQEPF